LVVDKLLLLETRSDDNYAFTRQQMHDVAKLTNDDILYDRPLFYIFCCSLFLLQHPFNGLFQDNLGKQAGTRKAELFWILMKQKTIGWQWYQSDHMQIVCTSLQADNHASTSSLSFYRPDALPDSQPTAPKH